MSANLILTEDEDGIAEYKLKNENNEEISSYTVERNKGKALISYETKEAFRKQGYASLGLNLLKDELFRDNRTLLLELINLSGDYSRKVAENAGFFSPNNSIDYFITLHPFAEDIVERRMQQLEKESVEYIRQERLLQRLRSLRQQQQNAQKRLLDKLNSLKAEEKVTTDERYRKDINAEIRHIERILGNLLQRNSEEDER